MKVKHYLMEAMIASTILLSGCTGIDMQSTLSSGSATSTADTLYAPTRVENVKIYTSKMELPKHYRIIGHVSAENYKMALIQNSHLTIVNEIKKQAASIGGNGVINIITGLDYTMGDVIVAK
jgi:hypothetical protein